MNQLCVRFPCERADIGHNLGPEQRVSFELSLDKVTLITKDYLTERIEQAYIDQWKVLNKNKNKKSVFPLNMHVLLGYDYHFHYVASFTG